MHHVGEVTLPGPECAVAAVATVGSCATVWPFTRRILLNWRSFVRRDSIALALRCVMSEARFGDVGCNEGNRIDATITPGLFAHVE